MMLIRMMTMMEYWMTVHLSDLHFMRENCYLFKTRLIQSISARQIMDIIGQYGHNWTVRT